MHTERQKNKRGRVSRLLVCALVLSAVLVGGCGKPPAALPPETAGRLLHAGATETSGLTSSRRAHDLLWSHNDSKGQPVLHAIGTDGQLRGTLRIQGAKNIDWEDIASFELDGASWLLIADTGDNSGKRKNCALLVVAEPDPALLSPTQEISAPVAWRLAVTYPDTPHDCEAVAVDQREERVYLVTKRTTPAAVYSLPLRPPAAGTPAAPLDLVARLNYIPQPNSRQKILPTPTGRYRAYITGADIAADGSGFALLTYGDVFWFPRRPGEKWQAALNRPPVILAPHGLTQAEAICVSAENRYIYVTSERKNASLLRYKTPPVRPE